jgi:hypothetical protein
LPSGFCIATRRGQSVIPIAAESKRALPYLSLSLWADGEIQSGNNMETTQQNDQTKIYQSNFRAEDGLTNNRSKALYEGIVVPFAAVFTVFLILLGAMAVTH